MELNRWSQRPSFLLQPPDDWPVKPTAEPDDDSSEFRKSTFCGVTSVVPSTQEPQAEYNNWKELLEATVQELHGAANQFQSYTTKQKL